MLFILFFSAILFYHEYASFLDRSSQLDDKLLKDGKEKLQTSGYRVAAFLESERSKSEEKLKAKVHSRLLDGYGYIENIYNKYKGTLREEEIKKKIVETFSNFSQQSDSYFFIFDKDFTSIQGDFGVPLGSNLENVTDYGGRYLIKEIADMALTNGEGFTSYQWKKPGKSDFSYRKVSYVKYFEPLGWVIGTGGYLDDIEEEVKTEALYRLDQFIGDEATFYCIMGSDCTVFAHSDAKLIGKNCYDIEDPVRSSSLENILRFAVKNKEGYFGFDWNREGMDKPLSLAGYNVYYPDWGWVVSFGMYVDDIRKIIDDGKYALRSNLIKSLSMLMTSFLIVFTVAFFVAKRYSNRLNEEFGKFLVFFENSAEYGAFINIESLRYEEFQKLGLYANHMAVENRHKTIELESARDNARRLSYTKSELISHISHELRTPLAGVLGFIELLDGTELDNVQKRFLGIIKNSAGNLVGIVNDILDFSKIETGNLVINYERFNVLSAFESMSQLFGFMASESGIEYAFYIDREIPSDLEGDVLRINQVLSNIVENAIHFNSPGGTVVLDITAVSRRENTVRIRFRVEDDGIGISENKQAELEKLFSTYDTDISGRFEGLGGIGLGVSSNIVKLMNGEIGFSTIEKKGSTFFFELDFKVLAERSVVDIEAVRDCYAAVYVGDELGEPSVTEYQIMRYLNSFGCEAIYFSSLSDLEKLPFLDVIFYVSSEDTRERFADSRRTHEGVPLVLVMDVHRRYEDDDLRRRSSAVVYKPLGLRDIYEAIYVSVSFTDEEESALSKSSGKYARFTGTALVAEDNPVNQKMVKLILKELGLESVCVSSGREAVDVFKQGGIDVVIMDINMPELGGIEAAKLIKEYEKGFGLKHTPVIALTAYAVKGDRERFLDAGMDDYLAKPVSIDIMSDTLTKHLISDDIRNTETEVDND
jgi:signal transduction histidine kinase/CheY-like chemotaxis protein